MKTILRIIIILLVASAVAGTFSLAVKNSSTTSTSNEGGQSPAMTGSDSTTTQPIARPEGDDRDGGSITQGLSRVFATLMKLTGITILVLVLQKGFSQLGNLKWKFAQR